MAKPIGKFFEDRLWCWWYTQFQQGAEEVVDSKDEQKKLHTYLRTHLHSPNEETAWARLKLLIKGYSNLYPDLATWLEEKVD